MYIFWPRGILALGVCSALFSIVWWSKISAQNFVEEDYDGQTIMKFEREEEFHRSRVEDVSNMRRSLSGVTDCFLEPCSMWQDPLFFRSTDGGPETDEASTVLLAREYEYLRVAQSNPALGAQMENIVNQYRCRDHRRPCQGKDRGHTLLYAHRNRNRMHWKDASEFDGTIGVYDDLGVASPFEETLDVSQFRQVQEAQWCDATQKVLVMAAVKKGYGLTNQLLSLCGQIALAGRTGRVVAIDAAEKKMRIPLHKLLDVGRSFLPRNLRGVVWYCNYTAPVVMPKLIAPHSIQAVDRKQVALRPHKVMSLIDAGFDKVRSQPLVFMHEMYLRYPFEQERDWRYHPASLFCGFQFAPWITRLGHQVVRGIRRKISQRRLNSRLPLSTRMAFAAWHLRLEVSDALAMRKGRAATSAHHVRAFIEQSLLPLLQKRNIDHVLLCSGPLPANIRDVIMEVGKQFNVEFHRKEDFLSANTTFDDFGTAGRVRERTADGTQWTTPTATDAAAVDAIALEKADVVVLTTTSSLSALIYAKRCGGNRPIVASQKNNWSIPFYFDVQRRPHKPQYQARMTLVDDARKRGCTMIGFVYLYDVYLDGSLTELLHYPCGYQFHSYLPAPPALVPRPPEELDVFAFRFLPNSPLFRREAWRNRPPSGQTPIPMERP
jgi:hypothetical protein